MKRIISSWLAPMLAAIITLTYSSCCTDELTITETTLTNMQAGEPDDHGVVTVTTDLSAPADARFYGAGVVYTTDPDVIPDMYNATTVKGEVKGNKVVTLLTNLPETEAVYARTYIAIYPNGVAYSDKVVKIGDNHELSEDEKLQKELAKYKAPEYADDYRKWTGWDDRSKWNLANVHDPTVVLADDGYYYMFQTDASFGNSHTGHGHFLCRRSKNLVDWEVIGAPMEKCPDWVLPKINELRAQVGAAPLSNVADDSWGYWAPCVRKIGENKYRMYYSIVVPGYLGAQGTSWGERGMIGMMETTNIADPTSWEDKGYVISSPTDKGSNWMINSTDFDKCYFLYNGIDPSYIITPTGEHWLIYGSWHSGIVEVQINPETGMPLNPLGSWFGNNAAAVSSYGKRIYSRVASGYWARWQGSEGAEIVYNEKTGYYYLFVAYDQLEVDYNTRVLRSKSVMGPFVDITGADRTTTPGTALPVVTHPYKFSGDQGWVGISHCAVFNDGGDNWFFSSQGRFPNSETDTWAPNAVMLGQVRRILWTEDGWPLVMPERYGAVPQAKIKVSEIAGTYEAIDITYEKGKQHAGVQMTLKADGTVEGSSFDGQKWEYNEDKQVLTIGLQKLYLSRECDWESSPRRATIVYAGYSSNGNHTYWGKKMY